MRPIFDRSHCASNPTGDIAQWTTQIVPLQ
jgi:hypothetical protein